MIYNIILELRKEIEELKQKLGQAPAAIEQAQPVISYNTETQEAEKPTIIIPDTEPAKVETYSEMIEDVEATPRPLTLQEQEIQLIRESLRKHNGKRKEVAKELGISERTLYRKIKQYDL